MKELNIEKLDDIAELLKQTIYFKNIPFNELKNIAKIIKIEKYEKNEIIFKEKDKGDSFYIIAEGEVEVSIENGANDKKILSTRGRLEGFGELAIIDNQERSATVQCLKATTILKLKKDEFERIIGISKEFTFSVIYV